MAPGAGSKIRDGKYPDEISESLVKIFGLTILQFFVVDPGFGKENFGLAILDKGPGSATLLLNILPVSV
jgi:hypothetical protein